MAKAGAKFLKVFKHAKPNNMGSLKGDHPIGNNEEKLDNSGLNSPKNSLFKPITMDYLHNQKMVVGTYTGDMTNQYQTRQIYIPIHSIIKISEFPTRITGNNDKQYVEISSQNGNYKISLDQFDWIDIKKCLKPLIKSWEIFGFNRPRNNIDYLDEICKQIKDVCDCLCIFSMFLWILYKSI